MNYKDKILILFFFFSVSRRKFSTFCATQTLYDGASPSSHTILS